MKYPSIISDPKADRKSGCPPREDLKNCGKRGDTLEKRKRLCYDTKQKVPQQDR